MLDPTASRSNFVYSIKKFLIETLFDTNGIPLTFDQFMYPGDNYQKWVSVIFSSIDRDVVSDFSIDIFCISRSDPESDELAALIDTVVGSFVDNDQTDGKKRIPFYDRSNLVTPIGYLLPIDVLESDEAFAIQDKSRYVKISVLLRMATK